MAATVGAYRNVEGIQLEQETGAAPFVVPLDEVGVPTYDELVLVANSERLESDADYADRVRRLASLLVDGTRQAIADPKGAVAVMDEVSDYETGFLEKSVPATLALLTPDHGPIGCMDETEWQAFGGWLAARGLLDARLRYVGVHDERVPRGLPSGLAARRRSAAARAWLRPRRAVQR